MNDDIPKKWVGGVCLRDNTILLIHRVNKKSLFNQECFIFPGKIVEGDESAESALKEEMDTLTITVDVGELLYSHGEGDEVEEYYLCTYAFGEVPSAKEYAVGKDGVEDGTQSYNPIWVSLDDIDDLIMYPESVKNILLEKLVDGK